MNKLQSRIHFFARILMAPEGLGGGGAITSGDDLEGLLFGDQPEPKEEAAPAKADEALAKPEPQGETDQKPQDEAEDPAKAEGKQEDDEPVYVVKIDGQEIEITESELLQGYQRQQDYTRKTQSLAEQRRQFEAVRDQEIQALRSALAYHALPTAKEPRPEDFVGKPDQFVQAYNDWKQQVGRQSQAKQLLEAITAEETQRVLQREAGLLQQAVPEWANEETRQADYQRMISVAADRYGFTAEEVAGVMDHRLLLLLRDASRVAALDSKPISLQRKTELKPKMAPGPKQPDQTVEIRRKIAMDKLKRKGDVTADDAVALLYDN